MPMKRTLVYARRRARCSDRCDPVGARADARPAALAGHAGTDPRLRAGDVEVVAAAGGRSGRTESNERTNVRSISSSAIR